MTLVQHHRYLSANELLNFFGRFVELSNFKFVTKALGPNVVTCGAKWVFSVKVKR
jgi:hypothetical protein